jgi:hypothetical protein
MQNYRRGLEEKGFASLVIAIVLVIILSLITVGFAELMRKEQKSALDKHLSQQAYYAAESGVNDAAKAINAGFSASKSECPAYDVTNTSATAPHISDISDPYSATATTSSKNAATTYLAKSNVGPGVDYTCLLIDPLPKTLEFSGIDIEEAKTVELTGINPANNAPASITDLVISWQDNTGGTTFRNDSSHNFTPVSGWGSATSALRIALTPLFSPINRKDLSDSTFTAVLYPNSKSPAESSLADYPQASIDAGTGGNGSQTGQILDGDCNTSSTPKYCNVKITNLNQFNYLLDLRSLPYGKSRVTISAYNGTMQLKIKNAQTTVDATGRVQDVLRRVQVRIPSKNNYSHSDFGIESTTGICKLLQLTPDGDSGPGC